MSQSISEQKKSGRRLASLGKTIHLKDFLPGHLEQSDVGDFMDFFEDFLNTLYYNEVSAIGTNDDFEIDINGVHTYYATSSTSAGDVVTSADSIYGGTSAVPVRYEITSADTISILEKAKRIADLHDPDLIDIAYIQRLANLLGYKILVDKVSISNAMIGFNASTDEDVNNYLKFFVSNLPNWYRIKTTRNQIKTLLFSFGIVGDIIYRWTSDVVTSANPTSGGYGNDLNLWDEPGPFYTTETEALSGISDTYFPTPHFNIRVYISDSSPSWFLNIDKIVNAIESIRPINNVFDRIELAFKQVLDSIYVRMDSYDRIKEIFPINDTIPEWTPDTYAVYSEVSSATDVFTEVSSATTVLTEL